MNFMNRKLFRGRAARDKLNKMGGIMASSQPLMNTVQNFQVGGNVRSRYVPGQGYPARPIPGTRPTVFGFGSGDLPTATDIRQSGLGQFISKNLPTAENARRKITTIQEFLKPARTAIGDFMTERDQRRAGGIETMRGPTAEDLKPVLPLTASEEALQAGQIPTMRGPTAADVREGAQIQEGSVETLRGPRAEDIRDYAGRREQGSIETLRGPTADDVNTYFQFGQGELIKAAESEDPEAAAKAGQQVANNVKSVLEDTGATEEEKNETALEFLGLKDPGEKLSKKEQIEKNKEFYREVFGTDPEEDKKVDGYNLAMLGFMIASGDSPNALQNIARGAAQGVKGFMQTAEKRKSREDKLTQLAVADYQSQLKSDAAREEFRLNYNLKIQELLDKRDQAKTKTEKDRINAVLSAVDDPATALVIGAMDNLDELTSKGGLERVAATAKKLIAINPNLAASDSKFRDPRSPIEMVDNFMSDYRKADSLGQRQIRKDVAGAMGIEDPNNVTISDIRAFAEQQAAANVASGQRIAAGQAADPDPAAAPAATVLYPQGTVDLSQFPEGSTIRDQQGRAGKVQADGSVVAEQ